MLRTCKYGKTSAGTAKLFAAITLAVAAAFVFSALSLAAILIYGGGIGDAGNAIQSLESYKYCPYTLTIAQAALLAMIMRCAAAAALTCVFAVLCRILSEPITSFAACAAALGGVYALDASGTFISHTGIIAFAGGEPFLMRYILNVFQRRHRDG